MNYVMFCCTEPEAIFLHSKLKLSCIIFFKDIWFKCIIKQFTLTILSITLFFFFLKANSAAMSIDEPWVGTWRPHKPRGPIAALYGSPGPKYALPALIGTKTELFLKPETFIRCDKRPFVFFCKGISQHDPTKFKAPVFSFGARHKEANTNCSPGPRYLIPSNITRKGRNGAPAFSIHGRPKQLQLFRVPGPGQRSKIQHILFWILCKRR